MSEPPQKYYVEVSATSVAAPVSGTGETEFYRNVPLPRNAFDDLDEDAWEDVARRVYPEVKITDVGDGPARWRVALQRLGPRREREPTNVYHKYKNAAILCMRLVQVLPRQILECFLGKNLATDLARSAASEDDFAALPFEAMVEKFDACRTRVAFSVARKPPLHGTFRCVEKDDDSTDDEITGGAVAAPHEAVLRRDWVIPPEEFVLIPVGHERNYQWVDPVDERDEIDTADVPFTVSKLETPLREFAQKYGLPSSSGNVK